MNEMIAATRRAGTRFLAAHGIESGDDAGTLLRLALRLPGGVEMFSDLMAEELRAALDNREKSRGSDAEG